MVSENLTNVLIIRVKELQIGFVVIQTVARLLYLILIHVLNLKLLTGQE